MAYKTMNTRFEERLLLFMAYGTRNLTFEARFLFSYKLWNKKYCIWSVLLVIYIAYRTRPITFEARFLWFIGL